MNGLRDRDFVNVVSELSYWQERFDSGSMVGDSFRNDCAPVIKLACDIYLRDPHGSHRARLADLQAHLPLAQTENSAEVSAQIAQLCWDRLGENSNPPCFELQ
ncbi:hypothetical protein [Stenotrophomonas sp. Iso1]|uniref:hypothetical protein n=1 Tax=Stenotrophomonas sp. Iso1 TaxID=2977283 RepID=UPI0022B7C821|nr:hypothetical protein [Stenotrophomonas sp. Iso1]